VTSEVAGQTIGGVDSLSGNINLNNFFMLNRVSE